MEPSDEALLRAAQTGDRSAVEALLARHEKQIYRFGLRMCGGDEETAREVLQETLLAAFRNLSGFRGDAQLSTWLYQIARSFCIKERRRERPEVPLGDEERRIPTAAAGPDGVVHAREIGRALSAAIGALPVEQREAIVLRDVEGLSAEEAARVIGIEVGALKSRLHRARAGLRTLLAARLGEPEPFGSPPCPELARELSAYVTDDDDQAACAKLEAHLQSCARCAGANEALERSVSLCRRLPGGEVPPSVRAAVRRALQSLT